MLSCSARVYIFVEGTSATSTCSINPSPIPARHVPTIRCSELLVVQQCYQRRTRASRSWVVGATGLQTNSTGSAVLPPRTRAGHEDSGCRRRLRSLLLGRGLVMVGPMVSTQCWPIQLSQLTMQTSIRRTRPRSIRPLRG